MRFRRRLKIAKGIYVNLSKSGASLSVGPRGASVTMGRRGTYLNTGIPGTGIYDRKRIGGGQKFKELQETQTKEKEGIPVNVSVSLDEQGKPKIKVTSAEGVKINEASILQEIKRKSVYKKTVKTLLEQKRKEMEETLESMVSIYKSTPPLRSIRQVKTELDRLTPQKYNKESFAKPWPDEEDIRETLKREAKKNIHSIFFWNNRKKRRAYVTEMFPQRLQRKIRLREKEKKNFEEEQNRKATEKNKQYRRDFRTKKRLLTRFLIGNEEFVHRQMEATVKELMLPVDFSLDYDYEERNRTLFVDVDLPEIEEIPKKKVKTLASDKISIKKKTQKEIKHEYALCVCGIAFYFAGLFFNISAIIKYIQLSGYTQRINRKNGHTEEEYIYSVRFERTVFENLNLQEIDPIEAMGNFENKMNVTKTFIMRAITPFGEEKG